MASCGEVAGAAAVALPSPFEEQSRREQRTAMIGVAAESCAEALDHFRTWSG
jgi:hypothetical protein